MLVSGVNPVAAEKDAAILKASGADWQTFLRPMEPFLQAVGENLRSQVTAFEPEIASYAEYALSNQGKQLRPSLVGSAGNAGEGFTESLVKAAVIVEMVHLATLVHDDIMDEASVRRRRPTLCAQSGNEISVLLGDCLFARSLELASEFPTTEVCQMVARATRNVCSGEILQTLRFRKNLLDREQYLHTLKLKTAELFALSCELGGLISNLKPEELQGLRDYGFSLGIAYQIYDDCLDIFGDEAQVGKSLGTDLATGKLTLPVLLLLDKVPEDKKNEIKSKLFEWNGGQIEWLVELLKRFETLEESIEVMQGYVRQANASLNAVEGEGHSQALQQLLAYLSQQVSKLSY